MELPVSGLRTPEPTRAERLLLRDRLDALRERLEPLDHNAPPAVIGDTLRRLMADNARVVATLEEAARLVGGDRG